MDWRDVTITLAISVLIFGLAAAGAKEARPAADMQIHWPIPHQVVQRVGYVPENAHVNHAGGPVLGYADARVEIEYPAPGGSRFEYRILLNQDAFGQPLEWTPLETTLVGVRNLGNARIPAGGWYRLEVRCLLGNEVLDSAAVEPIGVGEIFLVAGQSYAAGANDELMRIEDPQGRVVAYDVVQKAWRVAHDPQPNLGEGGTIWPPMANLLLPLLRVPIGLVNVAVGATSSRQWLQGGELYDRLAAAAKHIGKFRFVLWQQGESDVIEKVETEKYYQNLISIRRSLAGECGFEPTWLLAKSTHHPTVYKNPIHEDKIRAAITRLWRTPGFGRGPDTDVLGGENRGGPQSRRHFSGIGQKRAGLMWFAAIWCELHRSSESEER